MARISASILSFFFDAKRRKLSSTEMVENINSALRKRDKDFDILHLDIGDGSFIPSETFTPAMLRKINCAKKKEAHLMVVDYSKYIHDYFHIADMFIMHNEVLKQDFPKTIDFLKKNGKFIGISISPKERADSIKYLDKINLVLVMSVHPGLPGQEFLVHSLNKVKKLKELREKKHLSFSIAIDGGIDKDNMKRCIDAGADILVMGSGFFR